MCPELESVDAESVVVVVLEDEADDVAPGSLLVLDIVTGASVGHPGARLRLRREDVVAVADVVVVVGMDTCSLPM